MISELSLQRTFSAVGSLGRWEYLLHVSCFLVFSDIVLVLTHGVSIGEIDFDWLRSHASLGTVLVVLVGYSFAKSFLLPVFDLLYFLLCLLPVISMRIRELPHREVEIPTWVAYSMLTRNTPAYREYERVRSKNLALEESSDNCRHLALLLLANFLVGIATGKSFASNLYIFINSLHGEQRYLCLVPVLMFVFALGFNALLAPLGIRVSMRVGEEALLREVRKTIEISEDPAKLEPEIEEEDI